MVFVNAGFLKPLRIGVIGYGYRARHMLSVMKTIANIRIDAICDIDLDAARQNASVSEPNASQIRYFVNADQLFDMAALDGVVIGTRCATHADMTIKGIQRGLPLYLEKPVAVNDQQLSRLMDVAQHKTHKIVVSFPLRLSPWVRQTKQLIDQGVIGPVQHVQAVNNVPYGHVYFQSWYRDNIETGGLFLQKATHDFDYINYLLGRKPVEIAAMISKNVYCGNHRPGLFCKECEENNTCKESPYNPSYLSCKDEWMKPEQYMCAFAPDAANEDCGSALIRYENNMHTVYSQNFFVKHKAGTRGARLIGYDGTIEFDWYTDHIKLFMHHTNRQEMIKIELPDNHGHGGGDFVLAQNFIDIIRDNAQSLSSLEDGILSALMCLRAKESAAIKTFLPIKTV